MTSYTQSERGFKCYQPIATSYGHTITIHESSAAESPHLWLTVDCRRAMNGDEGDFAAHLSLEQAEQLQATLAAAIASHYQQGER